MKKNKKLSAMAAVIIMLALAACSNVTEEAAAMEEVSVPETTSSELLVDSLEYLLNEEGTSEEGAVPKEAEKPKKQEEDIAEWTEVVIYYGNSASDTLNTEVTEMEQVTAEELIDALIRHNIVSLGTKVNSFEEEEQNGERILYLDLSKAFREYLKTMTKEGENIIMASVTATFLEAYDADAIIITVDDMVLETNYAVYDEPLHRYTEEELLTSPENSEEE